jgi:hypothetical protein
MGTTETLPMTKTKLNRIAWLSKQDREKEFDCLMHLFNHESLIDCFQQLDKNKAVGIDGIDFKYQKCVKDIILSPLP